MRAYNTDTDYSQLQYLTSKQTLLAFHITTAAKVNSRLETNLIYVSMYHINFLAKSYLGIVDCRGS